MAAHPSSLVPPPSLGGLSGATYTLYMGYIPYLGPRMGGSTSACGIHTRARARRRRTRAFLENRVHIYTLYGPSRTLYIPFPPSWPPLYIHGPITNLMRTLDVLCGVLVTNHPLNNEFLDLCILQQPRNPVVVWCMYHQPPRPCTRHSPGRRDVGSTCTNMLYIL